MKATGIIRRMDDLGRVVIPKEIRHSIGMREGDAYEIFISDGMIVLNPYRYNISDQLNAVITKADTSGNYSYATITELKKIARKLIEEELK